MSYATQQDMIDRFGEQEIIDLTDRTGTGEIDVNVLGKAFADADSQIDSYLMGRYTLPLSCVPDVLMGVAADISRYRLLGTRPHEVAGQRYKDAIRWLQDVAAGRANLDLDTAQQQAAPGSGPTSSAPDRVFTDETLEDF